MKTHLTALLCFCLLIAPAIAGEQGVNANKSGQRFETIVSQLLEQSDFDVQMHSGYEGDKTELNEVDYRLALRQPPFPLLSEQSFEKALIFFFFRFLLFSF